MTNRNLIRLLCLIILMAGLTQFPRTARSEMYVEGYLGGTQAANIGHDFKIKFNGAPFRESWKVNGRTDPAVIGGLKIGTWFVKEGFLGFNYPGWMKYFGFNLDFSYHRLDMRNQGASYFDDTGGPFSSRMKADGTVATLAFMFSARYGFLPDSEVPFGRLQPYVSVGPGLLFTSMAPVTSYGGFPVAANKFGARSDTAFCLATEAGLRWMALKNVSIDLSFKYRYARPEFTFHARDYLPGLGQDTFTFKPDYHLFSGQLGVAYHF